MSYGGIRQGRSAASRSDSLLTIRRPANAAPDQRWAVQDSRAPGRLLMVTPASLPSRVREAVPYEGATAVFHGRVTSEGSIVWGTQAADRLGNPL